MRPPVEIPRCPECGGPVTLTTRLAAMAQGYTQGRCRECGWVDEPEWSD